MIGLMLSILKMVCDVRLRMFIVERYLKIACFISCIVTRCCLKLYMTCSVIGRMVR